MTFTTTIIVVALLLVSFSWMSLICIIWTQEKQKRKDAENAERIRRTYQSSGPSTTSRPYLFRASQASAASQVTTTAIPTAIYTDYGSYDGGGWGGGGGDSGGGSCGDGGGGGGCD